jgi:hypothetical protein
MISFGSGRRGDYFAALRLEELFSGLTPWAVGPGFTFRAFGAFVAGRLQVDLRPVATNSFLPRRLSFFSSPSGWETNLT